VEAVKSGPASAEATAVRRSFSEGGPSAPLVAAVVLTFNEERNLDACLGSLAGWVSELHVVDSGSTDETLAIAARHGAQVASHAFETHARQWQWALQSLPIQADWVLALDADQRVTAELALEIAQLVTGGDSAVAGGYVKRRQVFRGRWIRHGGYYPKYLLKLFRRSAVWIDETDLVDHHFHVRGATVLLDHDIIEDNRNEASIAAWTAKHNRYAVLQAREQLARAAAETSGSAPALFGSPDERVLWLKRIWNGLPLYWRPVLYFGYRYVLRLGFLDGREGFVFHVLQALWYRLLVDINIDEMRRTGRS
jgi:glycosyltransferase involved in cell wall biosynthesis